MTHFNSLAFILALTLVVSCAVVNQQGVEVWFATHPPTRAH